jgi:hypothetical protein
MAGRTLALTVVALFEGTVDQHLERWRRFYDPLGADRIPPHLPLVGLFHTPPPVQPLERRLSAVCHSWSPVRLELGDVDGDGGLFYVDVTAAGPELARLRDALHTGPFQPRVVVAEPESDRERTLASRQLLGLPVRDSYELERLHLMAAHADGSWYVRDFFGLDGTYVAPKTGRTGSVKPRRRAG